MSRFSKGGIVEKLPNLVWEDGTFLDVQTNSNAIAAITNPCQIENNYLARNDGKLGPPITN
jgi:hypothetical protein